MIDAGDDTMPPYAFVPGGPWPHPTASPAGHSFGKTRAPVEPVRDDDWSRSAVYLRGIALFNAGYYWEAHEAWEALWHAHERRGATADMLKALIKLAAAGVKVREGQRHGVVTHARRAGDLFEAAMKAGGRHRLGLDLQAWSAVARCVADEPPHDPAPGARVSCVFGFRIELV
ncbi:MAG: DUF309 domain-containing protein [Isosphaeraceae bacterium]|nr:DUF309 domain-containing protein [Isosphaeraceae bacterium]